MQFCCTVRGLYAAGAMSVVGCDHSTVATTGYFTDSDSLTTYQECFHVPEPSPALPVVESALATAVSSEIITVAATPGQLTRNYAVIIHGENESAYRINVGSEGTPEYIYCTGRGAVEGTMCRMNGCGDTTGNFVVFGAGPSDGDFCYHTCFSA